MANDRLDVPQQAIRKPANHWYFSPAAVFVIVCVVYLGTIVVPPSLMDDVDAVQAQIARNMLTSGDWVTARLDGVVYLEKSPLIYWLIAIAYKMCGVRDWVARVPVALSAIGLAMLTAAFGIWAFGRRAGSLAGLIMATCVGLWLFTRILIPDVMLTLAITLAMWALLRVLDEEEEHPTRWAFALGCSLGVGLLLKSLIAVVFPCAAVLLYLLSTRQLFSRKMWKRLNLPLIVAATLAISAPWHVLATIRNPPYFAWTLSSSPGHYHGFLWFYFVNEQLLRFLNLRYPRDYNTVPRLWFWLLHLVWLFPWSVYFPAVARLSFRPVDRAGRTRLLALCLTAFVLVFFTFSTTQEYYSMPCYPALALLLGSAVAEGGRWIRIGSRVLSAISFLAVLCCVAIFIAVRQVPTPGDITAALSRHPAAYTLALGHMQDITLNSLSYLRVPLAMAGFAFLVGAIGCLTSKSAAPFLSAAIMMVIFFQAARLAMVTFDPLLSSRGLAQEILQREPGQIILDHHYYWYSSIPFYTGRSVLLVNGRWNNFEYGSNAPGVPDVFIDDEKLKALWPQPRRYYLIAKSEQIPRFSQLVGSSNLHILVRSAGKVLATNEP